MPIVSVVLIASTYVDPTVQIRISIAPVKTTAVGRRTLPGPGNGSRVGRSPRVGRAFPPTTITARITKNGIEAASPGVCTSWASAVWIAPSRIAAPVVIPNEANEPTGAAAGAGTTRKVSVVACSPTSGATRMPASADSTPAIAQLASSIRAADHPKLVAASRCSATAVVARPNEVYL